MTPKKSNIRYKRILTLGRERVGALNAALAAGTGAIKLAQVIQTEWKALTYVKTETLAKQLLRYRAEMLPNLVAKVVPGPAMSYEPSPAFEALEQLRKSVLIQTERVDWGHAKEVQAGFLLPFMNNEVVTLHNMLLALLKTEIELGLRDYKGPAK